MAHARSLSATLEKTFRRNRPLTILLFALVIIGLTYIHTSSNQDGLPKNKFPQVTNAVAAVPPKKPSWPLDIKPKTPQTGDHKTHQELFSASTSDQKYFRLKFGSREATNANIIATPNNTLFMVAVLQRSKVEGSVWFAEIGCEAHFVGDVLACIDEPYLLPIPSSTTTLCDNTNYAFYALSVGPHDARVFWGPEHPYIIYGANSQYSCFGMWLQDFRMLVDWGIAVWPDEAFRLPTDLQNPTKPRPIEKNWFAFWDAAGKIYLQHDMAPRRVFAELSKDGTVGRNLGANSGSHDGKCIAKYLPQIAPGDVFSAIHQATNSLSISLCRRTDPACTPSDENTFIMSFVQHKHFTNGHAEYEPYVYLFQRNKPFKLYGIGKKPFWIAGREVKSDFTEMFYVTSINWRYAFNKYHGFLDDTLLIGFGIQDERPGAIDVVAADLFQHFGLCDGY